MDHLASFFTRSPINIPYQEQTLTSIYLLRDIQELSDGWRAPERYKLGYLPPPLLADIHTAPPSLRGILARGSQLSHIQRNPAHIHTATEKSGTYAPFSSSTSCCADEKPDLPVRLWPKACQVAPAVQPGTPRPEAGRDRSLTGRGLPCVYVLVCVSRSSRGIAANRHNTSTSCHPKPASPMVALPSA